MLTREHLAWTRFRDSVQSFSVKLSEGKWSEEDFAKHTGELARSLDAMDPVLRRFGETQYEIPYTFRWVERNPHFDMVLLTLKQGMPIPPHDHPRTTGVALIIGGSACIATYELEDPPSQAKRPALRIIAAREYKSGSVSTLTSRRDNIHSVHALDDFCHILDIFAPPKNFLTATIFHSTERMQPYQ
jgi:hypothetical protein